MSRPRTLRRRVVVAFIVFAAVVCLAYSALSFLFVYAVEDQFFAALLENEATHIASEVSAGREARPRLPFVHLYGQWESVPREVRDGASPHGREVAGADGRHYHIRRVRRTSGDAWLVAEVSSLLVVRRMRSTLLTILIPATAAVLLVGSIVAGLVARRSVRQLTALADAVERSTVSAPRELGTEATDHEVRVVATALRGAFERVHALLAREKAFVGDVSHELRTPLAIIRGAAELLERRDLEPTARAQVGRILEAAQSSEEIIGLLLALAREETAHEPAKPIALLALVETVVLRHRHILGRADLDVQVDIAPQMRVMAPPAAAEVVISNLITNALRHGGGTTEIVGREGSLAIRDNGRGLDPALSDGRGIGLNLVRRLCDLSGFALTFVSSTAGTSVTIGFSDRKPQRTGVGEG
jgi:signal transduction histidine kinase